MKKILVILLLLSNISYGQVWKGIDIERLSQTAYTDQQNATCISRGEDIESIVETHYENLRHQCKMKFYTIQCSSYDLKCQEHRSLVFYACLLKIANKYCKEKYNKK